MGLAGGVAVVMSLTCPLPPSPHCPPPHLQVLLRSQRLDALLSRLLPHGQLLFLNHRFALNLEKEAVAAACTAK